MTVAKEESATPSANDNHSSTPTDDWQDALEEQAGGSVPSDEAAETEQFNRNSHHGVSSSRQRLASKLQQEEEEEEEGDDAQLRRRNCQCCRRWPRSCAIFVGVILPLWLIIILSVGMGSWLAVLELPGEIRQNNNVMRARKEARDVTNVMAYVTGSIPRICWQLFLEQRAAKINQTLLGELLAISLSEVETEYQNSTDFVGSPSDYKLLNDDIVVLNTTEMNEFMEDCGKAAQPYLRRLLDRDISANEIAGQGLTFNWMRCTNATVNAPVEQIRYDSQEEFFSNAWTVQQKELYQQYLLESPNTTQGILEAYDKSLEDASGGDDCLINRAASCWFWFTVMTTMGYGNQAPTTSGGRALVFTFGFVSILIFGVILARAGNVASVILDSAISRVKLISRRHVANTLCWSVIWILWMLFLAYYTRQWKIERLGDDIDFSVGDGYWFAYISSTTVGLGDYFLEPEVLLLSELFLFSLIFLAGFTFLSAFLTALSTHFAHERRTFIKELLDTIKDKDD